MKRYAMGFWKGGPAMFEQPQGEYVKWADVQLRPGKATDAEIQEWADRHDLGRSSITELRCIFEDAESAHLTRGVAEPAHSKSEYKRRVAQGDPSVLPPSGVMASDGSKPE